MVSIITINYNNSKGLRKTIDSVISQTYKDIEYIVIDGGSTDGSVDVIHEYANFITYWISEKDKGIYFAMNKGAKQAHGEYCFFLNSGDRLYAKDSLSKLIQQKLKADLVCANLVIDDDLSKIYNPPDNISAFYLLRTSLPHPSTLIRTSVMLANPYNEKYRIISDWAFMFDVLVMKNATYQHVDSNLSVFYTDGVSSKQKKKESFERNNYLNSTLPPKLLDDLNSSFGKYFLASQELGANLTKLHVFLLRALLWINRKFLK